MTPIIQSSTSTASLDTNLANSIRAALAGDPRAATVPREQLDALVLALTKRAQVQGLQASQVVAHGTVQATTTNQMLDENSDLAAYMPAAVAILVFGVFLILSLIIYIIIKVVNKKKKRTEVLTQ